MKETTTRPTNQADAPSPPRTTRPYSLRTRFLLLTLLAGFGGLFAVFSWFSEQIAPRYTESIEESLVDTAYLLAAAIESKLEDGQIPVGDLRDCFDAALGQELPARIYDLRKDRVGVRIVVTDFQGRVLYDSDGRAEGSNFSLWNDVGRVLRGEYGARATRTNPDDPWSLTLHVAAPIRHDRQIVGVISVAKPMRSVFEFAAAAQQKVFLLAVAISAGSTIALFFLAEIIIRPLDRLRDYARAVRDGLAVRLPSLPGRTLREVGSALEEMRESLEGRKSLERHLLNLAHELKSPLAAIHGASELLTEEVPAEDRKRFATNIRRETRRMQQIITKLLQVTSLESGRLREQRETFGAVQLARETIDNFRAQAEARHLAMVVEAGPDVQVTGERYLLSQALGHLVDNAVSFSPTGGRLVLIVENSETHVLWRVRDHGPGIPDYARARLFEQFYSLPRPDTGQKSTGLGLVLAREIARRHDGDVSVRNHPEGGAEAEMRIGRGHR